MKLLLETRSSHRPDTRPTNTLVSRFALGLLPLAPIVDEIPQIIPLLSSSTEILSAVIVGRAYGLHAWQKWVSQRFHQLRSEDDFRNMKTEMIARVLIPALLYPLLFTTVLNHLTPSIAQTDLPTLAMTAIAFGVSTVLFPFIPAQRIVKKYETLTRKGR